MALQSISKYVGFNPRGLLQVQYLPIHYINQSSLIEIITDANNFLYAIPLSTGSWLSLPFLPTEDIWQESPRSSDQGPGYEQSISLVSPKLRAEVSQQFEQMEKMRFVIQLKDKAGQNWLIGEPKIGLEFSVRCTTGNSRGLNNYQLSFSGVTSRRSSAYQPSLSP